MGFVAVIAATYLLKKAGVFTKENGQFLSKLMMNVTMPCALLSAGVDLHITGTLLLTVGIAVVANIILVVTGILLGKKEGRFHMGLYAIAMSGFNVGSFGLPFVQYFFPASMLGYVCMFDMGNAIMGLGVNNTIGAAVAATGAKQTVKGLVKRLSATPPFMVYMIVIALALFGLSVPEQLLKVISIAGNANAFVAMAMIGLLLELCLPRKDIRAIGKLMVGRYGMIALMSILIWLFMPAEPSVKMVIILCIATPITSIAAVFCKDMVGESDIPAALNSLAIITSLIVMTTLMIFFQ